MFFWNNKTFPALNQRVTSRKTPKFVENAHSPFRFFSDLVRRMVSLPNTASARLRLASVPPEDGEEEDDVPRRVLYVHFNRPGRRNALSEELYTDIAAALRFAASEGSIRAAVLTGDCVPDEEEGSEEHRRNAYYSSGNDLGPFLSADMSDEKQLDESLGRLRRVITEFFGAFIDFPKPLIAQVNGHAVGAAATTLAMCDFVYCTAGAELRTPFVQLAFCPEGCSSLTFPRLMGPRRAHEMLMLGRPMGAEEAVECGFVNGPVCSDRGALRDRVSAVATALALSPVETILRCKRLMRSEDMRAELHRVCERELDELFQAFRHAELLPSAMKYMAKLQAEKSKL
jgi:Delta3-Delta2-enoyl-CoA isomerase